MEQICHFGRMGGDAMSKFISKYQKDGKDIIS